MLLPEKQRFEGYCKALLQNNIPLDNKLFFKIGNWRKWKPNYTTREQNKIYKMLVDKCVEAYLAMEDKPTALCGLTDTVAILFMQSVQKFGVRIPEDLSVAGFDDIPYSNVCAPKLTTVHQNIYEFGVKGIECMLNIINGHHCEPIYYIKTDIIVRESTSENLSKDLNP